MAERFEARYMTDEQLAEAEERLSKDEYPEFVLDMFRHIKAIGQKADHVALASTQLKIERDRAIDEATAVRTVLRSVMDATMPDAKSWLKPQDIIEMVHRDSVSAINSEGELGHNLRQQFNGIQKMVAEFEETTNEHMYHSDGLVKRIQHLIIHYQQQSVQAVAKSKAFRDDMLTWLRAMSLVVEMAGNAGTHQEKNARLRGMVELIESVISKLQNERLEFAYHWWNRTDLFKSDYPVREFVQRIHELERENEQLKKANPQ